MTRLENPLLHKEQMCFFSSEGSATLDARWPYEEGLLGCCGGLLWGEDGSWLGGVRSLERGREPGSDDRGIVSLFYAYPFSSSDRCL